MTVPLALLARAGRGVTIQHIIAASARIEAWCGQSLILEPRALDRFGFPDQAVYSVGMPIYAIGSVTDPTGRSVEFSVRGQSIRMAVDQVGELAISGIAGWGARVVSDPLPVALTVIATDIGIEGKAGQVIHISTEVAYYPADGTEVVRGDLIAHDAGTETHVIAFDPDLESIAIDVAQNIMRSESSRKTVTIIDDSIAARLLGYGSIRTRTPIFDSDSGTVVQIVRLQGGDAGGAGVDDVARTSANIARAEIDEHEAHHPAGADLTARNAAAAAQADADAAIAAALAANREADAAAVVAAAADQNATTAIVAAGNAAILGEDALANAATAQADIDEHEAEHPEGGGITESQVTEIVQGLVSDWAEAGNDEGIPGSKTQRKIFVTNVAPNINTEPEGASNIHDILIYITAAEWQIWEHTANAPPYRALRSTLTEGGVTAGALIGLIAPWSAYGNEGLIPPAKTGLNAIQSWALAGGPDIPWAQLDGTLYSWTYLITQAALDAGAVRQIIPDEVLPAIRLLPHPVGANDGQLAVISDDTWVIGDPAPGGSGGHPSVGRWRFRRGEDTPDPFENAGKVFLGWEYIDRYETVAPYRRTSSHDIGGYSMLPSDLTRGDLTISFSEALDVRELLAQSSVAAVSKLVTDLPGANVAAWGEFYALSDVLGQVNDIYYRREADQVSQLWLPARLHATNRDLHGFNDLTVLGTYGYDRGGALSPQAEIVQLIEERDINNNITLRMLVPDSSPLNSPIALVMEYRTAETDGAFTQINLFYDALYSSTAHSRYVTAVYEGDFLFEPGSAYEVKWRRSGDVNDLVLHADSFLRRIADDEDLDVLRADLEREIYQIEDALSVTGAVELGTFSRTANGFGNGTWHTIASNDNALAAINDRDTIEIEVQQSGSGRRLTESITGRVFNALTRIADAASDAQKLGACLQFYAARGFEGGTNGFGHGMYYMARSASRIFLARSHWSTIDVNSPIRIWHIPAR